MDQDNLDKNQEPTSTPKWNDVEEPQPKLAEGEPEPMLEADQQPLIQEKNKRPKSKLLLIISIIIGLTAIGFASYFFINDYINKSDDESTTSQTKSDETAETVGTSNTTVNETSNILIDSASSEATEADTDDVTTASDTQQAINSIGDSVHEDDL